MQHVHFHGYQPTGPLGVYADSKLAQPTSQEAVIENVVEQALTAGLESRIIQQAEEYADAMIKHTLRPLEVRFVDQVKSRAVRNAFQTFIREVRKAIIRERAEILADEMAQRIAGLVSKPQATEGAVGSDIPFPEVPTNRGTAGSY